MASSSSSNLPEATDNLALEGNEHYLSVGPKGKSRIPLEKR